MLTKHSFLRPRRSTPLTRAFALRRDDIRHILTKNPVTNYTRDHLRQLVEDPNFESTQIQNLHLEALALKRQSAYSDPTNEKNPANLVKVTFTSPPLPSPPSLPYNNARILNNPANQLKPPFILRVTPQWMEQGPIITARRRNVKGIKKPISLSKFNIKIL